MLESANSVQEIESLVLSKKERTKALLQILTFMEWTSFIQLK